MRIVNVTFHGIGRVPADRPAEETPVWISEESFAAILDHLAGVANARITFDDGNATDVRIALPALAKRGMKAQFFVCSGLIGREGYLSVSELRELTDAGMTVGSHGMAHKAWRKLQSGQMRQEITEARDRLEQLLGARVSRAACPFGAYDRLSLAALRECGFERVYTSDGGSTAPDAWLQARNSVHRGDAPEVVAQWIRDAQRPVSLCRRVKLQVKRWR